MRRPFLSTAYSRHRCKPFAEYVVLAVFERKSTDSVRIVFMTISCRASNSKFGRISIGGNKFQKKPAHLQRIVLAIPDTFFDLIHFAPNSYHGLTELIELLLVLGFGRLDHQRVRHRPGHGRCMETVVLQPFGDIHRFDAGFLLEIAHVHDEFVRAGVVVALVQDAVVLFQHSTHIVRIQNGYLGRVPQTVGAHQLYVGPGDRQNGR